MERSLDIDSEGWEVVPNARHLEFEHGSEKELLLSMDIVADYFSNHNNSTKEEPAEDYGLPPLKYKDIEVVPSTPPSVVLIKNSNDDGFIDRKVESPMASTKEPEHMVFDNNEVDMKIEYPGTSTKEPEDLSSVSENEKEYEFYMVEKNSEKEIEAVKPEITEKHPCWVIGLGALCSIGMAAATICILILSKGQLHNKHQHRQNPKIQFQIYADDKSITQVVQQATRLNHAISTTRAHISFGGYYDGI